MKVQIGFAYVKTKTAIFELKVSCGWLIGLSRKV